MTRKFEQSLRLAGQAWRWDRLGSVSVRTARAVALCLLGGALCAPGHAFARSTKRACPRAGVRVLAIDTHAEIYELPEPPGNGPSKRLGGIYGCAFANGRRSFLASLPEESAHEFFLVPAETIAGVVGAISISSANEAYGSDSVLVTNLATGRRLTRIRTNGEPATYKEEPTGRVDSMVVMPDGTVAWMVTTGPGFGSYRLLVHEGGQSRTLASGPSLAPKSLALAGDTLYWTEGGHADSATIH